MARPGLTYDQIADAANSVVASGRKPTLESVRSILGSGSNSTIHSALKKWREANPAPLSASTRIPDTLLLELSRALERAGTNARAELEQQLAEERSELDRMASETEVLEDKVAVLQDQVAHLQRERDQAVAVADSREREVQRLQDDLDGERKLRTSAEREVAALTVRLEVEREARSEEKEKITLLEKRILEESSKAAVSESMRETLAAQLHEMQKRVEGNG
ncbi:replication region DNA-binding N-term [Methylomagnum ishizawai]|uniref:Replication region DNA-binding N-term n=1 Tax=Methylomagnum ishizawai TaxID=1760988 RepID=A0A1Y6DCD4_9GAMM|nr:DNA-binding protein [Methylomagnum ishizawai]SMF97863.1 replication region DNA-binding N-term [Methylomagnum ishizawai]SMF97892.1 replication region DNA-binding N-term [Methylomagnum ishizawai]